MTLGWYRYFACLLSGFFIASAGPRLVRGISHDPSLSGSHRAPVNVFWPFLELFLDLALGYMFLRFGNVSSGNIQALVFFAGIFVSITVNLLSARMQARQTS